MRRTAAALLALATLLALLPTAQASGAKAKEDLDGTLGYLADLVRDGAAIDDLAPYLAEAASAAGLDVASWPAEAPVLGLLEESVQENAGRRLIDRLRSLHALAAAGRLNLTHPGVAGVLRDFSEGQFGEPGQLNDDIWALLTLRKAGLPASDARLRQSAAALAANQTASGGFGWLQGENADSDTTGMALEALAAAEALPPAVATRALGFLADQTDIGGGVGIVREAGPNCDSTVWAIRGYVAAGEGIPQRAWQYLAGQRLPNGAYAFSFDGRPSIWCTAEVATVLGLAVRGCWQLDGYGGRGQPAPGCAAPAKDAPVAAAPLLLAGLAAAAWARGARNGADVPTIRRKNLSSL